VRRPVASIKALIPPPPSAARCELIASTEQVLPEQRPPCIAFVEPRGEVEVPRPTRRNIALAKRTRQRRLLLRLPSHRRLDLPLRQAPRFRSAAFSLQSSSCGAQVSGSVLSCEVATERGVRDRVICR
jgi:hypothetical protein